ncbi:MAG TPA: hypothetical protein VHB02_04295 [Acidimicrobiales bacterium]|nr:hypothetical protein [Acidimicrobiales bacterium]
MKKSQVASAEAQPSARQNELLENAYQYVLAHGLSGMSLRPLAAAIGSSPRVLLFLFGSKDGLIRALLTRARADEMDLLASGGGLDFAGTVRAIWGWVSEPSRRPLLALWAEAFARSLNGPDGPWAQFAGNTVGDWLSVLAAAQPPEQRTTPSGAIQRSLTLAVIRGSVLDLLATGDVSRTTEAVELFLSQDLSRPAR